MGDELVGQHEGIDPELIAKGIFDEESEFPYINVPITFTNMNGICKQCNRSNTFANWCQPCNSKRFQKQYEADKKFSSGNKMIDEFISYVQENASRPSEVIEWIPYERLINIRFFEKNYFKNRLMETYIANWMDGYIIGWDQETNNWKRNYTGVEVLLKKIDDSCVHFRSPGDFLNEIKSQFKLNTCDIIIKCYGITRDPYTGTYFMVMQ
ncbi:hypothetical protein RhiirA5_362280 [Rhizophagus irregularis]|nr:hypothetical protein RirG_151150 [Rhizophagus irregularis DAOM 197198w]PKC04505.1 hypothetical protein RhiirA5_362280 [Rhizophagus irregularis]PKC69977.1 hypothetical protein RhiirA1_414893 [Rhizophagus irregularis]PKK80167.1 hypothetical protein RhiirC2_704435 [Rhizophagus irregularis]PKY15983.1 hypothetical protein RhiirB3_402376 [Rhizophagus irregularis]